MKTVFVVKRNADFTEGRGPMVLDSIFESFELAVQYIKQKGIPYKGDTTPKEHSQGYWSVSGWYDIAEMPIFDKVKTAKEEKIEKALKKLSKEEIELLRIDISGL